MSSQLTAHWRDFIPQTEGLHVHPEDHKWLEKNSPDSLRQRFLDSFAAYSESDRFGIRDHEIHLSLLPVPFVGNLETADILIFLQNPGLAAVDYLLEENKDFRSTALRNLHQETIEDYPFWCLNPAFAWSGAFNYWEGKFRPIIRKLQKERTIEYREALRVIANRVAAVQLFPYHSVDGDALGKLGKWCEMPSTKKARQFLAQASRKPSVLKLLMRSHKSWLIDNTYPESPHFHQAPHTRGFTFNHELSSEAGRAGKMILKKLATTDRIVGRPSIGPATV